MCNCSSTPANICNQCSNNLPCCCPPDYTIVPASVPCGCCPSGYSFVSNNPKYPGGICAANTPNNIPFGPFTSTIPCNSCAETITSDCVVVPAVPCLGFLGGTLTAFVAFLCSAVFIESILTSIGLNSILGSAFCQLTQNCPPAGSGTIPIITSIIVTFP